MWWPSSRTPAASALHFDEDYLEVGAEVVDEPWEGADLVVSVNPLDAVRRTAAARPAPRTVSFLPVNQSLDLVADLRDCGVTSFAMELVPRISRAQSMDALSSQSLVSGYRCAIVAAGPAAPVLPAEHDRGRHRARRPRSSSSAPGSPACRRSPPAKRLGAVVKAYDVRAAAAEEIRSMGAVAIELELETLEGTGGYAREMTEDRAQRQRDLLAPYIAAADALITTAAVPGRQAPLLVTAAMVEQMKPGSVVVDLAAETGGNVEGSQPGKVVQVGEAQVWGGANVPVADARPGLAGSTRRTSSTSSTLMTVATGRSSTPTSTTRSSPAPASPTPVRSGTSRPARDRAWKGETGMSEPVVWLTIFVLSVFVGIEVISKVSSTLHTPLMSGANAIHGVILVGAILVTGHATTTAVLVVGLVAIVLARQHGRRFRRHRPDAADVHPAADRRRSRDAVSADLGAGWSYLVAAVCFILALKGLSSPRTARNGNLIGAAGAVLACVTVFFADDLDHVPPILVAIAVGTVHRLRRRPPGPDDPDAAAGRAVQRRRRRRGGAGRPARADAARSTLGADREVHAGGDRVHDPGRRRCRFAGSLVTFAKLQELMTTRPVVFPGLPIAVRRCRSLAAVVLAVVAGGPAGRVGRRRARAGRAAARRAAGAAGRRRRRADRDLAAQRVHRPHRRRRRLRARQHRCCWSPAPWSAPPARFLTKLMAAAMGRSVAQHPVRRAQGRLDARAPAWPRTGRCARPAPEDVAILLGYAEPGDHRPRLRAGRRPGAAHAARAGRRAERAGHRGRLRDPPGRRAGCPGT